MVLVRKSVWANGGDFNDPLLFWYAKGVGVLQSRAVDDRTSWRFMAAIHGFDQSLWQQYGYLTAQEPLPPSAVQQLYWRQCQHQTWYFLPWHRGYIWAIESLLRQAISDLGGPSDWAFPYWNYSDTTIPNARLLPPAFARTAMPDGSPNPLFVKQRYGLGTTPIVLPSRDVTLEALTEPVFTGTGRADPGFGGLKTGFSHGGSVSGRLESKPHNIVHVDIGGQDNVGDPGLMSDPDTAGLDPIFWLHHANIDRLWVVWNASGKQDPTDAAWTNGPMDRKFVMPDVKGDPWVYTPGELIDTTVPPLGYVYDQFVQPKLLAAATPELAAADEEASMTGPVEMMGANDEKVELKGAGSVATMVHLDTAPPKAITALREGLAPAPEAHRMLLSLENIRSSRDGMVVDVYLNLPEGEKGTERPDRFVGSIGLFGARKATDTEGEHAGNGLTEVLDVTNVMSTMAVDGEMDGGQIEVRLVPRHAVPDEAPITVDRISLNRQTP